MKKMKQNALSSMLAVSLVVGAIAPAWAGPDIGSAGIFSGNGTNGAVTVVLPAVNGRISLENVTLSCVGATTLATYERAFPEVSTTVNNPTAAAATALTIRVEGSAGTVGGKTPAANMIVFVADSSTNNSGTQYATATTVGNVVTNISTNELGASIGYTRVLGLGSTVNAATNDIVWVATSSEIISVSGAAQGTNILMQGIGAPRAPVSVRVSNTGTTTAVYGYWTEWKL